MKQPVFLRIYRNGKLEGVKQFAVEQIVIGKNSDVQVPLADDGVSPLHAVIEERDSGYYISDLGSQNGTLRNGEKIFDEKVESGDEITIGPFRLEFFVGIPKPTQAPKMDAPTVTGAVTASALGTPLKPVPPAPTPTAAPPPPTSAPTPPPAAKSAPKPAPPSVTSPVQSSTPTAVPPETSHTETPPPVMPSARPKSETPPSVKPAASTSFKQPVPGALVSRLKKSEGPVVQISIAWGDRIISTHHFSEAKDITAGSDASSDIVLPVLSGKSKTTLLKLGRGVKVCLTPEMSGEVYRDNAEATLSDLKRKGRIAQTGDGFEFDLAQGEMIRMGLLSDSISVFVRFVPDTAKPLVGPIFDLTASETTAVIMAGVISAVFGIYMALYSPTPLADQAQLEQPLRKAVVTFSPPKKTVAKVAEVKQEKKIVQVGGTKNKKAVTTKKDPGKAGELRPNKVNKKVAQPTSTVNKGGAVNTRASGANAKSQNRDVKNEGLLSVFGSKGAQKELSKAYSGSGELQGLAESATGTAGQNEDRVGDSLGGRLKNVGIGGKGTSTSGFSGVGTKGKGSGTFGYGSGGIGEKGRADINIEGSDAEFTGSIDREAIRRVILENKRSFKYCYDSALRRNSDLYGRIEIQWDIVEQGRVQNGFVKSNSVGDKELGNCIVAKLRALKFPEPPPDQIARVVYPFVFAAQ